MTDAAQLNPVWWPRFWRSSAVLAVCALLALTFAWTLHWMTIRWDEVNSYYSHGWLIAPISIALVYRQRKRLAAARVRPLRWGLALLVPCLLLHLLGTAWQVGFLSGFALIGVLAGAVLTLFGAQVLRILLFPLLFLAFMVPLPVLLVESVSFRLKLLAARLATGVLGVAGLPAVREGSFIHIPNGTVVVEDVCSGLKYVISLTAFGALYAHISSVGRLKKGVLFLASVPISFAANVLRVTLMVIIAYFFSIPFSEKWYIHGLFGFVLFGVAFVLLFATEALLRGRRVGQAPARQTLRVTGGGAPPPAASGRLYGVTIAVLAVATLLSAYLAWPRNVAPASDTLAGIGLKMGPWSGVDYPLDNRTYAILGTRDVLSRVYTNEVGERVELVVVLAQETRKRTHPPEQCMTGEGYSIQKSADRSVILPLASGPVRLDVRELVLDRNDQQRVVWYFYKTGNHLTTSYWKHQIGLALSKLTHPDAADILIRVDTFAPDGDLDSARQMLTSFLSHAFPEMSARLP